ncbi:hypothetical protein [Frankia tisae]|uniref:hypothetical protein n=1 Tax=Frankia tisae TaxID=2950104 RepID=UPI0021BFE738|nr:hypothetical protein [Frankia tisae]
MAGRADGPVRGDGSGREPAVPRIPDPLARREKERGSDPSRAQPPARGASARAAVPDRPPAARPELDPPTMRVGMRREHVNDDHGDVANRFTVTDDGWRHADPGHQPDPGAAEAFEAFDGGQTDAVAPSVLDDRSSSAGRGVTSRHEVPRPGEPVDPDRVSVDPVRGAVPERGQRPDPVRPAPGTGESPEPIGATGQGVPGSAPGPGTTRPVAALAMIVGAVGCVVGSVLPWSEMSSADETRTFNGIVAGDGRLVLVLAVLLGVVGAARLARRPIGGRTADILVARLAAAMIVVIAGLDRAYGPPTLASFRAISADVISIHPQNGIMVTLASGIIALIGAVLLRPRTTSTGGGGGG